MIFFVKNEIIFRKFDANLALKYKYKWIYIECITIIGVFNSLKVFYRNLFHAGQALHSEVSLYRI